MEGYIYCVAPAVAASVVLTPIFETFILGAVSREEVS